MEGVEATEAGDHDASREGSLGAQLTRELNMSCSRQPA